MNKSKIRNSLIKVFAIDDEALFIMGLKKSFSKSCDNIEIVGTSSNINDALIKMSMTDFDIILLDLWLGKRDPVENVRKLKEIYENKPIVILTCDDFDECKQKILKLGVHAYVNKSAQPWQIDSILCEVAQGKFIFDPLPIHKEEIAFYSFIRKKFDFTKFQLDLIILLLDGDNLKIIASKMNKSVSSIYKEFTKIKRICHVSNLTTLIYIILN